MTSRLRGAARWLRYLPDRLLHPYRRKRARASLESLLPEARTFLFVCYGNICRSPFAAELFAREAGLEGDGARRVLSAGFHPVGGRAVPETARRKARERGIELSGHSSRTVPDALDAAGTPSLPPCTLVMEAGQRERIVRAFGVPRSRVFLLGDFDPEPIGRRAILDPFGKSEEVFERVYDRIERCVEAMARVV